MPADAARADAGPVDAGEPFALAAGEVAEVPVAADVAALRLATPTGAERFVLVVASMQLAFTGASVPYRVEPRATAASGAPTLVTGCSLDPAAWRAMTPAAETPPAGAAPAVGAERTFRMPTGFTAPRIETITARAVAVSEHAVVWTDVTSTLDPAVVAAVLRDYETTILPRGRVVFGTESDIDADGRVSLVFSPLTAGSGDAFFWQCDLVDFMGCGGSNRTEALYLTPLDLIRPPYNTVAALAEIVAHELGHLIHFGRKVLRNRLPAWVDSEYMIEGFGHLAQDVSGFQGDNLYATKIALDAIGGFSLGELLTDRTPYVAGRAVSLRGGAYLFTRWLYDRAGGDDVLPSGALASRGGPALVRALFDAPASVAAALPTLTGARPVDLAMDFFTALAASNRDRDGGVVPANACFRYAPVTLDPVTGRPRGADLFAMFDRMAMRGPAAQPIAAADGSLRHGGVEYLLLDATAGQSEVAFTVRSEAAARLRVRVARVR